jgi:hypothetical protein
LCTVVKENEYFFRVKTLYIGEDAKANETDPKNCLGRVFIFKLDHGQI